MGICLPDEGKSTRPAVRIRAKRSLSTQAEGGFPLRSKELAPKRLARLLLLTRWCAELQLAPFFDLRSENRPIRLLDLKK